MVSALMKAKTVPIDAPYKRDECAALRRCGRDKAQYGREEDILMRSLCLSVVAVCEMKFLQRLGGASVHADLACIQLKPQDASTALAWRRGRRSPRRDDMRHLAKGMLMLASTRVNTVLGVTVVSVLKFQEEGLDLDADGLTCVEVSQATKTDMVYTKWMGDLSCLGLNWPPARYCVPNS
jgi:hypothetical protein